MNLFGTRRIYLDYASATPLSKVAAKAMAAAETYFANPGGLHADAVAAKKLLEQSRTMIAHELAAKPRQIVFTSGLTESNNLAILGRARRLQLEGKALGETHWIVSAIEHSSVLEVFGEIERLGGIVSFVDPDPRGLIAPETLANILRKETVFVSIGWANNEIGVVQPLSALARVLRAHEKEQGTEISFHTDAGQAPLYLTPHVHTLGVDLCSLGSGKLYGPRGIGALYVRDTSQLAPILLGGGQEIGLRSGTEEVALSAGFATALASATAERAKETKRLRELRDRFAQTLCEAVPGIVLNSDLKYALPHMLNLSVPGERSGEYLALQLDRAGISLSTKSACDEGNKSSHVMAALGGPEWRAEHTLRISLGRDTTKGDMKKALTAFVHILGKR